VTHEDFYNIIAKKIGEISRKLWSKYRPRLTYVGILRIFSLKNWHSLTQNAASLSFFSKNCRK
jgi:hypothetical protein